MFHDTLKLPIETPDNLFIEPSDSKFIQRFLKIVGYEGIVDKVSTFYRNLAQPWKTMFKWEFMHCVQQKKDVIQYPRVTKTVSLHFCGGNLCTSVAYFFNASEF
nr:hypothetical protein [Tanacetum cinerariifolium]